MTYLPTRSLTLWATICIVLVMAVNLARSFVAMSILYQLRIYSIFSQEFDKLAHLETVTNISYSVTYMVAGIVFLTWWHRTYSNILAFGALDVSTSPGWAVASFFIPIANLFRPPQILSEIWR